MAGIFIDALPPVVTPAMTDVFAMDQASTTFQVSNTQMLALYQANASGTWGINISGNAATATTAITATTATTATNSNNLLVTQVGTNASFFPLFVSTSTTGNKAVDLGNGLTFNPSTNTLTTTTFVGALTGNATTATSATTATTATTATNANNLLVTQIATNASFFPLFVPSSTTGNQAVDLGTGLTFNPSTNNLTTTTFTGALSGNATTATSATTAGSATTATTATNATNTAITDDTTTNATMYPTWVTAVTGNLPQKVSSSKLTYNPSTGNLASTIFTGALVGNASTATTATSNSNSLATGRLTLTTAVPVTTADVTGASAVTIYFTPFKGNQISLFDGTATWNTRALTEISIAVPSTTNTMYDVFVYDNAGTPTLELTAWTNDTTRATGLVLQNGVYVKSGVTTRRYLGSFRTTAVSGQTEDSFAKRWLWNYYNRVVRPMSRVDTTNTWNYSTTSFQQANAAAANQLDMVIGVAEDAVTATVNGLAFNATNSNNVSVGVGVNSTTVNSAQTRVSSTIPAGGAGAAVIANYTGIIAAGRNFLAWLEYGGGAGTTTWLGDNGGAIFQTGITGQLMG
jgi:hypothetical protein